MRIVLAYFTRREPIEKYANCVGVFHSQGTYYALINRARGPYEEIFVLTFKAYGPNEVRSMRFECQNKYFPYGPKSRSIRALLYTYTNKIIYDEILPSQSVVYCVSTFPDPHAGPYAYVRTASQPIRSKNSFRISVSIQ